MNGETKVTTDHEEIRHWAQERNGRPVSVKRDPLNPNGSIIQIDFLYDKYDDNIHEISWNEFFDAFENDALALVYQTETEGGRLSRFGRIVRRENVPQAVIE
jgi:hypothetical protein